MNCECFLITASLMRYQLFSRLWTEVYLRYPHKYSRLSCHHALSDYLNSTENLKKNNVLELDVWIILWIKLRDWKMEKSRSEVAFL